MRVEKLANHGWFVGSFDKAVYRSDLTEVCYRKEPVGPHAAHYHTRCTEILLIVGGKAQVNDRILTAGEIIIYEPGEINNIVYLEETTIVCVKTPAGGNDKVLV